MYYGIRFIPELKSHFLSDKIDTRHWPRVKEITFQSMLNYAAIHLIKGAIPSWYIIYAVFAQKQTDMAIPRLYLTIPNCQQKHYIWYTKKMPISPSVSHVSWSWLKSWKRSTGVKTNKQTNENNIQTLQWVENINLFKGYLSIVELQLFFGNNKTNMYISWV